MSDESKTHLLHLVVRRRVCSRTVYLLSQVTALVLYVTAEFNILISNLFTLQPIVSARGASDQSNPVLVGLIQARFCVMPGSLSNAGPQVESVVYL